jgi:pimeloyl-ACP methyl ester carboxylesterase
VAIVISVVVAMIVVLAGIGLVGWATYSFLRDNDDGSSGSGNAAPANPPPPSDTVPPPTYASTLARFYRQKLQWHSCGSDQCTRLTVPLDYAHPAGRTIRLAVLRVPAQQRSHRIGQLVVDPGGPGGSAVDYAAAGSLQFGPTLTRYFDIVGMDPRGVGESAPIKCLDTAGTDAYVAVDGGPDNPREVKIYDRVTRTLGNACVRRSGQLVSHVSTVEVAKDMDILRAALGERRLDYLGASYGTFMGATYAQLFPTHVRRMVLDGALDPALSTTQIALGQARGFETALRSYVQSCTSRGGCPLGSNLEEGLTRIRRLLAQIEVKPLDTRTDRPLTIGLATYGVFQPLYNQQLWPLLSAAFAAAIDHGDGRPFLSLADQYNERGPNGYTNNIVNASLAINCLDHDDYVPSSQVPALIPRFEKASPTFATLFAYGVATCADWPIQTHRQPAAMHAKGAPPIVVIGTTRDPATPFAWAEGLARELDSGRLIKRDGDGHTGFNMGNKCVDDAVENYLLTGRPPRNGLSC